MIEILCSFFSGFLPAVYLGGSAVCLIAIVNGVKEMLISNEDEK